MISLKNVTKRFGSTEVLKQIDLNIEPEKTTVLIGASGCGKSTLLRLMIGLIRPDSGEVVFENESLHGPKLLTLRRKMGYVIQDGGLFLHLTARRNVSLVA